VNGRAFLFLTLQRLILGGGGGTRTSLAANKSVPDTPAEKTTDCPKFNAASDSAVLSDARWYALAAMSKRSLSGPAAPK
jgi:hypothetical protein